MDALAKLREKFQKIWASMDRKHKIVVIGLSATLFAALLLLSAFATRTQYVALYTGLSPEDSFAVIEHLEAQGIDYAMGPQGDSILVDRQNVHRIRLQMAGEGIPTGGVVGFEIFDSTRLGSTEFEREINFYRALGGELSRTISEMSVVDMARVQITAPRQRLFVQDDEPVEATVMLKVAPRQRLDSSQVKSIAHLVAGSVEGLSPERVVIVNTDGTLLSEGLAALNPEEAAREQTRHNLEMQRFFEQQLQHDLERMLMPVLGYDNFVVKVNALLNFDQREETIHEFEPVVGDEGIIRSQQILDEYYSGVTGEPGGVPGTDTNIPLYEAMEIPRDIEQERFESITNYEINERIVSHVYAPGSVERLSVGVIIHQALEPQQMDSIQQTVSAAVGYNQDRGDQVYVSQLAFDDSLQQEMEAMAAAQEAARRQQMYMYLGGILVLALILFYIVRRIVRLSQEEEEEEAEMIPEIQAMLDEEEDTRPEEELSPEEKEWRRIKKEVESLINERPEEAANLLKAWLVEE